MRLYCLTEALGITVAENILYKSVSHNIEVHQLGVYLDSGRIRSHLDFTAYGSLQNTGFENSHSPQSMMNKEGKYKRWSWCDDA